MKASEAYRLTKENLEGPAIAEYIKWIDTKITQAIARGQFSVSNPFVGCSNQPEYHIKRAILKHYENEGYEIKHHDGDQKDPRDTPYEEISWAKAK